MLTAPIDLPRRRSDLGRIPPPVDNPRAAALEEFDSRLKNMGLCVHWLVEHGVHVLSTSLGRAGGIVIVAGSPTLRALIGQDCTWRKRRQDGALAIFTWFAIRFETRIEWEEPCA